MPYQKVLLWRLKFRAAKFNAPAIQALRLVGRRGYETSSKKVPGELTIYKAVKRAGGGS
jgi:hypothetical protein